jgi:hypothetical protein
MELFQPKYFKVPFDWTDMTSFYGQLDDPVVKSALKELNEMKHNLKLYTDSKEFKTLSDFCKEMFVVDYTGVAIETICTIINCYLVYTYNPFEINKLHYQTTLYFIKVDSFHFSCGLTEVARDYMGASGVIKYNLFYLFYYLARTIYMPFELLIRISYHMGFPLSFYLPINVIYIICVDLIHHTVNFIQNLFYGLLFDRYYLQYKIIYHILHWVSLIPGFYEPLLIKYGDLKTFDKADSVQIFYTSEEYKFKSHYFRKLCHSAKSCCAKL